MNLFLIRHGKTDVHLESRRQSPSTPLGEFGKQQAAALAEKMKLTKIDHLYSSGWPRALQTAEYLAEATSNKIKIHPHVHEIQKHPKLNDIGDESEINKRYIKEAVENKASFDWKFDGEGESLNEIIIRAQNVIDFLENNHPNDTVAIVSHGIFITIVTTLILLGKNWDKKTFLKLSWSLKVSNGGISSFKFDPITKHWTMMCFNDHSHITEN